MNKSKIVRWAALAVLGLPASLPALAAEDVQTAAGAQQFLSAMARQLPTWAYFTDSTGRFNYVTGKYTGQVKTIKGGAFGKPKDALGLDQEKAAGGS